MTTKKIESLTPDQVSRLAEFREKWLRIGLATGPADRPAAEAAVKEAYKAAGMEPPRIVIWLRSPLEGAIGAAMLAGAKIVRAQVRDQVGAQVWDQVRDQVGDQVGDQVRDQVGDQVWAQVRAQVWDQVGDQVRDQVWDQVRDQVRAQVGDQVWAQVRAQVWDQVGDQVRDQVWDQVRDQVWDQVGDQVRDQVWDQVRDQVRAQVGDQVWDQVYRAGYGQHDASWLGFYEFFDQVCDLHSTHRLRGMGALAQAAGWWWPFAGAVILTERPTVLRRDASHRLHCADGPAMQYPDGWSIYAWRGMRVPKDLVEEPEKISVARIDTEKNAEIRRVMIERFGLARYVSESRSDVVHEDVDPLGFPRRLLRKPQRDGAPDLMMVELTNSSPEPDGSRKKYLLCVEPNLRPLLPNGEMGNSQELTCLNAVASTFGLSGSEYQPSVET